MFPIFKLFGFSYGTFFQIQELFEACFKIQVWFYVHVT
jgi:hypothetical protein